MNKIKYFLLLCTAILFVACGGNDDAYTDDYVIGGPYYGSAGVPLLWNVTSPTGQTMYLFGSIHAGHPGMYPLPPFIMDAFERSDYLVVEIDMSSEPDFSVIMDMNRLIMLDGGTIITDYIDYDLHERAQAIMDYHQPEGWMPMFADHFAPFMWHITMLQIITDASELTGEDGIDMHFINLANERSMPIIEAESIISQMSMFANFSPELQAELFRDAVYSVENLDASVEIMRSMIDAWLIGDVEHFIAISESEHEYLDNSLLQEFNAGMLINRDIEMALVARDLMSKGWQGFFMVGLYHFLHEDSIIANLERAGYTVTRVLP